MRKFLVLIFSMPLLASLFGLFICFAPGSLAKKLHRGVDTHLRSLEKKNVSRLGKAQLATLYTSMILVGRVPFPESADNLFFLFFNSKSDDYALWPGYLAQSYAVRTGIAQADKGNPLYHTHHPPIQMKYVAKDKRMRNTLQWDAKYWYAFEPRIAYLYNPWSTRVDNYGLFRRVTIFQWMHFHAGETPIPPGAPRPIQLTDGLVHNASPDGKLNPFTAYASWIEPALPHSITMNISLINHALMRLVLLFALLCAPVLLGVALFTKDNLRRSLVARTLLFLGSIGMGWAVARGLWDLMLGISQVGAMLGIDSGELIEPYNQKVTQTQVRKNNVPTNTILTPIGWTIWRILFNYLCFICCKKIKDLGGSIQTGTTRSAYIKGSLCTLFPWIGLPFPAILIGFPLGIWLLWMTDTSFRIEKEPSNESQASA